MPVIGGTQIRTAAVHALGIVAGATRADSAMSASAEDSFRQVTFTAAAGLSGFQDPAEVLLGFLRQPFADLRTGGYRCAALFHPYRVASITMHFFLLILRVSV